MKNISAAEFQTVKQSEEVVLIDVREKDEYQAGHIPGADNFPLSELGTSYTNLDKNQPYYVVCQAGGVLPERANFWKRKVLMWSM